MYLFSNEFSTDLRKFYATKWQQKHFSMYLTHTNILVLIIIIIFVCISMGKFSMVTLNLRFDLRCSVGTQQIKIFCETSQCIRGLFSIFLHTITN